MPDRVQQRIVTTEEDAAAFVGYTPAALRAWRRQGRGPAYIRVGRSVRYRISDLDEWLGAHRVDPRFAAAVIPDGALFTR